MFKLLNYIAILSMLIQTFLPIFYVYPSNIYAQQDDSVVLLEESNFDDSNDKDVDSTLNKNQEQKETENNNDNEDTNDNDKEDNKGNDITIKDSDDIEKPSDKEVNEEILDESNNDIEDTKIIEDDDNESTPNVDETNDSFIDGTDEVMTDEESDVTNDNKSLDADLANKDNQTEKESTDDEDNKDTKSNSNESDEEANEETQITYGKWEKKEDNKYRIYVEPQKEYKFEFLDDEKVPTIKFKDIDEDNKEQDRYIDVEIIELSKKQQEALNSVDDNAYDITSGMDNGTFEYELVLPLSESVDENVVSVNYVEDKDTLEKVVKSQDKKEINKVNEDNVEVSNDLVSIKDLDHFTIFYVSATASGNVCVISGTTYNNCYPTIQEAINNASDGDTIEIAPDTYTENLIVNKELTLVGMGAKINDVTVRTNTNGSQSSPAYGVEIKSDNVTIKNIRFQSRLGYGFHFKVSNVNNFTIEDVKLTNKKKNKTVRGLDLNSVENVLIKNVTVKNYRVHGIGVVSVCGNNDITSKDIIFENVVVKNTKSQSGYAGAGIAFYTQAGPSCSPNQGADITGVKFVGDNYLTDNEIGITLQSDLDLISNSLLQICLSNPSGPACVNAISGLPTLNPNYGVYGPNGEKLDLHNMTIQTLGSSGRIFPSISILNLVKSDVDATEVKFDGKDGIGADMQTANEIEDTIWHDCKYSPYPHGFCNAIENLVSTENFGSVDYTDWSFKIKGHKYNYIYSGQQGQPTHHPISDWDITVCEYENGDVIQGTCVTKSTDNSGYYEFGYDDLGVMLGKVYKIFEEPGRTDYTYMQPESYIVDFTSSNPVYYTEDNLIENGDFETPKLSTSWTTYPDGYTGLGWTPAWVSTNLSDQEKDGYRRPMPPRVEIQKVYDGDNQYVELDGDWGTSQNNYVNGENANIYLYQMFPTCNGVKYNLSFDWSPRPHHDDNQLKVTVTDVYNNNISYEDTFLDSGDSSINWTPITASFVSNTSLVKITFQEMGNGDSYGALIDNVSVYQDSGENNKCQYSEDSEFNFYNRVNNDDDNLVPILVAPKQTGYNEDNGDSYETPHYPDENEIACTGGVTNVNEVSVHWYLLDENGNQVNIPNLKYLRQFTTPGSSTWRGHEVYTTPYTNYRTFGGNPGHPGTYGSRVRAWVDSNNNNQIDLGEAVSEWSNECSITYELPPVCGNEIVETGEECDGTSGVGEGEFCTSQCKLIPVYDGMNSCPDGTVEVPTGTQFTLSSKTANEVSHNFESGKRYLLKASGTYSYANTEGRKADAAYGTTDNFANSRSDIGIWGTNKGVTSIIGDLGRGMGVIMWDDDQNINSNHVYTKYFNPQADVLGRFVISDWYGDWYGSGCNNQSCLSDNNGSLTLSVNECAEVLTPVKPYCDETKIFARLVDSTEYGISTDSDWNTDVDGKIFYGDKVVNVGEWFELTPTTNNRDEGAVLSYDGNKLSINLLEFKDNDKFQRFKGKIEFYKTAVDNIEEGTGDYALETCNGCYPDSYNQDSLKTVSFDFGVTNANDQINVSLHHLGCALEACTNDFAVNNDGYIYKINLQNGDEQIIDELEFGTSAAASQPGKGNVYYIERYNTSGKKGLRLAYYDINARVNVVVGNTGINGVIDKLAFNEDGVLYAMSSNSVLYTVDITTGQATKLGKVLGITKPGGDLSFDNKGDMYVHVKGGNLYKVNLYTLNAEVVSDTDIESTGMVFKDKFYATDDNESLFDFDYNGSVNIISTSTSNINDLASCPVKVLKSNVTVCKVDTKDNYLEGWNVQLLRDEVQKDISVPVQGGASVHSAYLPKGNYVLSAHGTYEYRGNTGLLTDPNYSQRLKGDNYSGSEEFFPWINVNDFNPPHEGWLGVMVNNMPTNWSNYLSSNHTYYLGYTNYSGEFRFNIYDNVYSDNKNSTIAVDIYTGYAGTTGKNGCVTFENVPYGDYEVSETLRDGYINVTGLGNVEVNDLEETFTIENRDIRPAKVLAAKIVCDDEKYLPNWGANRGGIPINENTIDNFFNADPDRKNHCEVVKDWKFQWGYAGTVSFPADDFVGEAQGWNTFGPAVNGEYAVAEVPLEEEGINLIWVREVLQDNYIPFSFGLNGKTNKDDYSAEFYCNTDGANYDNRDGIGKIRRHDEPIMNNKTYYCVGFNAIQKSIIEGYKFNDLNHNGVWDKNEPAMSGWQIYIDENNNGNLDAGEKVVDTDKNGYYSFVLPSNNTYVVRELNQNGWEQTSPDTGSCEFEDVEDRVHYECNFGNVKLGLMKGYKFNDLNHDSAWGEDEPAMSGWEIYIDSNNNGIFDDGELNGITDENGYYEFTNLYPGTYKVCEVLQPGWNQSFPEFTDGCYSITLTGDVNETYDTDYNFGNYAGEPLMKVAEYNDASIMALESASPITFTIKLRFDEIEEYEALADNVKITHLLPEGVTYIPGSYTIESSTGRDMSSISEAVYHSPGTWDLTPAGPYVEGEEITLTLKANVDTSVVEPGVLKDITWAESTPIDDNNEVILAEADPVGGYVAEKFVGTDVEFTSEPDSPKANAEVEEKEEVKEVTEEGQVLGASTTALPATGASANLLAFAMLILTIGAASLLYGMKKQQDSVVVDKRKGKTSAKKTKRVVKSSKSKKVNKIVAVLIASLTLTSLLLMGIQTPAYAADEYPVMVRVEQPKTPTNEPFKLTFVAVDTANREVQVTCFVKNPDGTESQFDVVKTLKAGGNTDSCDANTSVLNKNGTYEFWVTAEALENESVSGASATSERVKVDYSTSNPDEPKDFEVDKKNNCEYKIKFKTADDGETSYVEVYRSDDTTFSVGESTRVKTISINPNEKYEYTDTLAGSQCGHTQYYAIRAFNSAGNPSDVVAQEKVVIVEEVKESEGETEETGQTQETEAIIVPTEASTVAQGGVEGAEVVAEGSIATDGNGEVKGAATENEDQTNNTNTENTDNQNSDDTGGIKSLFSFRNIIIGLIALLLLGGAIFLIL